MDPQSRHEAEIPAELASLDLADRPDGPGAAVMVSTGLGIFMLGLLTVLAEASDGVKGWLTWDWGQSVGALAGKTTIASLVYFGSLALLWAIWRNKDVNLRTASYVALGLGILGALGTFPMFFELFAA